MAVPASSKVTRRQHLVLLAVASGLALLIFAPVLARGFLLHYDMVFAPTQTLVPDSLGWGSALPRSVPADAVVALLTGIVPGDIVQKFVLLLSVFLAAYGAGLLVPTQSTGTRLVAATGFAWSAYFAERLFIGHWPLLLAYGCLPWIALAAQRWRHGDHRAIGGLVIAFAAASLTPPGGVLATGVALACAGTRRAAAVVGVALVLNAPWWVPSVLHPGGTLSDPAGVEAFASRAESWAPALVSVLGLGGIWNAEVVPASRANPVAPLLILLVVGVSIAGQRMLARRWGYGRGLILLGVFGVGIAALSTVPMGADLLSWSMHHVPGAGLLRDSQRWVAWWALPLALGFALGVESLATRLRARRSLLAVAAVLPMIALPDLAWAGFGRMDTARYPPDWAQVRDILAHDPRPGDVLALPLSAFRSFGWNGHRTQLDPAPRALPRTVLIDDTLRVGGRVIGGEDRRMHQVRTARTTGELSRLGVGWVLVEHGTPGPVPHELLAGARPIWHGTWLTLYRTPGFTHQSVTDSAPPVTVVTADVLASVFVALAVLSRLLPLGKLARTGTKRSKE